MIEAESTRIDEIVIVDLLGRVLFENRPDQPQVEINTAGLSKGMYLVKIEVEGQILTRRLEIVR